MGMYKKIISASVIAALSITSVTPAVAATIEPLTISSRAENTIPIIINGLEIASDQPPIIIEDRILVPLRVIFEALGATVTWNNDTRSVIATRGDISLYLAIGSNTLYKNGQPVHLDVPGQIINDRTMVPLRAVSESFGANVVWDNDTRIVYVDINIEPTPEKPDVDDPEISNPTEPEDPKPPIETPEEPDTPPVEPEYPEVTPPEEQRPSIDEQEKNIAYNTALIQFLNGYSYEAYYGFNALGDYKNSADLMNQTYWLNQLSYNVSRLEYQEMYDIRENYELLSEDEIRTLMPTATWLTPSMQSVGGGIIKFNNDGTATDPSYSRPQEIIWTVNNGGVFYVTTYFTDIYGNRHYTNQTLETEGSIHEFRKIIEGVYADIDMIGSTPSGPVWCNTSQFFVDSNSNIGIGLQAYWNRVLSSPNMTVGIIKQDENGIFYAE